MHLQTYFKSSGLFKAEQCILCMTVWSNPEVKFFAIASKLNSVPTYQPNWLIWKASLLVT